MKKYNVIWEYINHLWVIYTAIPDLPEVLDRLEMHHLQKCQNIQNGRHKKGLRLGSGGRFFSFVLELG